MLQGTRHAWETCARKIDSDAELHKLFTQLALRYRDRPGGFTRVVKAGFRKKDSVLMAYIE